MIYIVITVLLDIFLSLFISTTYQNINMFFPFILIGAFPIFYNIIKNKKVFFLITILLGLIYDTLFSDVFLINTYYFILYSMFIYIFYNNHKASIINILLISILGTICYDIFIFFVLILIEYSTFNINDLYYKLKNSVLINLIYVVLSVFFFNSRIFGHKKRKKR